MKKQIKQQWIKALKSGDYKPAQGLLCSVEDDDPKNVRFCCLGVLFDIAGGDVGGEWVLEESAFTKSFWSAFVPENDINLNDKALEGYLPDVFAEYVKLTDAEQDALATLNDEAVVSAQDNEEEPTFDAVIEWIKENL